MQGYGWINKPRHNKNGGGVAILIRDDIYKLTKRVEDLEDQDQEIIWIQIDNGVNKIYVGIYYGPQEKCSNEEAERQYSQLTTQINKLKNRGQVILMGDFNAKLEVKNNKIQQDLSRNGKHLEKLLEDTDTIPISLNESQQAWTRIRKRKEETEKSNIDYVIMTQGMATTTKLVYVDEAGIHKLKGKEETDHSTIIIEAEYPTTSKLTKSKITNIKDPEGWKKFNRIIEDQFKETMPKTYSEYERHIKEAIKNLLKLSQPIKASTSTRKLKKLKF